MFTSRNDIKSLFKVFNFLKRMFSRIVKALWMYYGRIFLFPTASKNSVRPFPLRQVTHSYRAYALVIRLQHLCIDALMECYETIRRCLCPGVIWGYDEVKALRQFINKWVNKINVINFVADRKADLERKMQEIF